MEFGVHLPHVGPFATPEAIVGVAQKAEELGYHSLWVSDHIITPRELDASSYPGGRYPVQPEWPFLEPLSTLMFAAAVTPPAPPRARSPGGPPRSGTEDPPSVGGRFYKLGGVGFYPNPGQKPHPPIWV